MKNVIYWTKSGKRLYENCRKWEDCGVTVREELLKLADENFKNFHSGLIPGNESPVIGVRMPLLKKKAKELARGDWRQYLLQGQEDYYEEIMLKGLVIGTAAMDVDERFSHIRWFIPKIRNWAVCDCFCGSLKFTRKYKKEVWDFLKPYLESGEEYKIRFGVVMLLDYFADEEYAEQAFRYFDRITHEAYYVRMAVAWAVSFFFIKVPDQTMAYLRKNSLDDWTYNKALQKITESFRVDQETKMVIRGMKRRNVIV